MALIRGGRDIGALVYGAEQVYRGYKDYGPYVRAGADYARDTITDYYKKGAKRSDRFKKDNKSNKRGREEESKPTKENIKKAKKETSKNSKDNMGKRYAKGGGSSGGGRNPRFTKKVKKRSGRKKKKSAKVLVSKKQVSKWNKAAGNAILDIGHYHHKTRTVQLVTCFSNKSSYTDVQKWGLTALKAAVNQLGMVQANAGAASTLITTDVSLATYSQKLDVTVYSHQFLSNNYAVPVWVDLYLYCPKQNTPSAPEGFITNGFVHQGAPTDSTDITNMSTFFYPTQVREVTRIYEIKKHKRVCLSPGESLDMYFTKHFTFDPTIATDINEEYQPKYGAHVFAVRLEGVFGHSFTAPSTNLGTSVGALDTYNKTYVDIKYDAGAKIETEEWNSTTTAQSGGTVVGWTSNCANTLFNLQ